MKQEGLKERVELLEIGEALGYPRLGYGRSTKIPHDKRIPQGKDGWERFVAHAHVRRILPALRIGRVLRSNNVQVFHPLTAAEIAAKEVMSNEGADTPTAPVHMTAGTRSASEAPAPDLLDGIVPEEVPQTVTLPRPKKGGHKKPPRPGTKRWLREQERLAHG